MSENTDSKNTDMYDVVVVGGGAAGLSGAMALGRSRRSVVVVDAGEPRNAPADHAHNYLGREGVPPLELLETGRAEVAAYGVEVVRDRVVGLSGAADDFLVTTEGGRRLRARRVLVTGGVVDELPDVPGLAERWGVDVLHCPYCHGWEVRDQAIAVLATSPMAGHQGLLFRQLSDDVVLVVHDGVELPDEELEKMGAIGVRVAHGTPQEVVTDGDTLVGLRLADGSVLERQAIVVASKPHVRADWLAPLGIEPQPFEMNGVAFGTVLAVEPTGATAVPGVFAAGNATDISMTLMASAAHGMRVGAFVNAELASADATRAVAERRAEHFERPAWEERYSGDKVWSGRANAQLVAEVTGLPPGRALEVGCGEGGDAIWLASQGWDVTAVDFADAALARTTEHAREAGVGERITTRRVDVRTFEPDGETWDLVTSHFVHLPDGAITDLVRRLGSAVAAGGTLLVVGHHPEDLATGLRHGHHSYLFTAEQLLPALDDEWEVEVCESRPRTQAHPHTGEEIAVADAVLRARRRSVPVGMMEA
ncbi:bifunctional NAD(P)/FAD-dependent oxidoreductase/class I SAM-dependent methyltransferase [Nocardioides sp. S-58]|uniref:Bifunctional NAD(P)/FAD-dependent oxidoreductase/class I SAM-dependent methyltransferase n=1 Tax=Nocardioides renjunii TaxID=3095075 RepID=A0ABU5K6Q2_9ACTN|nr:bifunctional NAD(P)/FAD-dependent oxidoreductase/class I SAM-dependent methyltransferase [Nocardioides sp. S-58]MDZ5660633.1 bifunctional NAD(P)/FAD-dependent oxidoreductase/class I SAM-dependent methyltransferase [Nocardioides sp. S-58]